MSELEDFRRMKDDFFRDHYQSPLTNEQQQDFNGLNYYPQNPSLRFDLPLERMKEPRGVKMQTSTGDVQDYWHIGQVRFQIAGEEVRLQVYEPQGQAGSFFVPFVDATAPEETYAGGRYLEPEATPDDLLVLDFNLAYNPYCA